MGTHGSGPIYFAMLNGIVQNIAFAYLHLLLPSDIITRVARSVMLSFVLYGMPTIQNGMFEARPFGLAVLNLGCELVGAVLLTLVHGIFF
jgi:hypothetical protein